MPPVHSKNRDIAPHLALIGVQILFGTWPIFGKLALRAMSSPTLVYFRVTGAAIAFLLIQRRLTPLLKMPRRDFLWLVLSSVIGVVANQFLFVKGLSMTTAINATLLSSAIPVFTLLVSIVFGYDRLSLKRILGIAVAMAGVFFLVNPARADFSTRTTVGNLLIISNSFLYATYIVISKDLFERYGALNVITWIFLVGAVLSIPAGLYTLSGEQLQFVGLTVWLAVGFIILFPTVGAYYLNAWALTKVSPSIVAVYIYLQPLIAFGLAPMVLGERPNTHTLGAALLIFVGVAIVTRRSKSQAVRELTEHPDATGR
jgi:drug/metabolite transporter (DMT)-like permease